MEREGGWEAPGRWGWRGWMVAMGGEDGEEMKDGKWWGW